MDKQYDIEQLLTENQLIQVQPQGYSMYPMFVPGRDCAIIERAEVNALKRGDVVLYRRPESKLVLHRIARRTREGFYLVGDNQTSLEGPVAPTQMRGILVAFIRKGHRISVHNPIYVCAAHIWLCLRPVRMAIMRPLAGMKKAWRKRK